MTLTIGSRKKLEWMNELKLMSEDVKGAAQRQENKVRFCRILCCIAAQLLITDVQFYRFIITIQRNFWSNITEVRAECPHQLDAAECTSVAVLK